MILVCKWKKTLKKTRHFLQYAKEIQKERTKGQTGKSDKEGR